MRDNHFTYWTPDLQQVVEQMRAAGVGDDLIRLASQDLANVLDSEAAVQADWITERADAVTAEDFCDANRCELALADTMHALKDQTLWLEASDPIAYRDELRALPRRQFDTLRAHL